MERKMQVYDTATTVSLEEFYKAYTDRNNIDDKRKRFIVVGDDGKEYSIKQKSLRYSTFSRSNECVSCGIEGKYFKIERCASGITENYHANLYGLDETGQEVLMTKDHIIRKEDGGKDVQSNLQTMCWYCNCVVKQ